MDVLNDFLRLNKKKIQLELEINLEFNLHK
jgi:hypothetical protein